ncbi:MAG: hypothetical protein KME07_10465 [Pegethrix bostrychoides GSE-TBD4-15B]|jgi:transposase-like protein|uniref:Transposase n=1 Tax=Pegethrix bostrychoides GSE-TBD4-15B TaxID=2839662 RepID=A0A951PB99_9CYAN|nr:hypothetical protein [Pegethrix bostrychoides GSE-TBD4-15B]
MPPKKLSDSDKQEILSQYRNSDETTVSLAVQYGVSTSTVSRFLKQYLAESEYEALVQKKRSGGRSPAEPAKSQVSQATLPGLADAARPTRKSAERVAFPSASEAADPEFLADPDAEDLDKPQRRQRRRVTAGLISAEQLAASVAHLSQLEQAPISKGSADEALTLELDADDEFDLDELESTQPEHEQLGSTERKSVSPKLVIPAPTRPLPVPKTAVVLEMNESDEGDDLTDLADLDDDDLDDLDDENDDDDDQGDEEGFDEADSLSAFDAMQLQSGGNLQILPLPDNALPRTCYVVVDRSSELITRPLKEFADLGQIQNQETQDKTLPIFDNHRVAKRFLRRMQRIVKVPDGRIFQKVKPYLQAKGITHLLIDGQIYSLQ